jgi:PAS domain S-box-containing protein
MTLEQLATYLNELIENSPVAILMLDPRHRVQLCNPAFERLFQYGREELINANLEDLITTHELTPEAVGIWKRVLLGEKVYASTKRRRKDGSIVDVEIHRRRRCPIAAYGQAENLNDASRVWKLKFPFDGMYWLTYQKVQSSEGSITISL